MKFQWETIHKIYMPRIGGSNTHRAKVIGGWLISNDIYTDGGANGESRNVTNTLCFIPDPNHEWSVKDE